jgi:hypothetical protein
VIKPKYSGLGNVPEYTADQMRGMWAAAVRYGEQHPQDADNVFDEQYTQACEERLFDMEQS